MTAPGPPIVALSLVQKYEHALASHPLRTQMIGTGLLFGGGDILCQLIDRYRARDKAESFNLFRTIRMVLHGFLVNTTLCEPVFSIVTAARPVLRFSTQIQSALRRRSHLHGQLE